MLRASSPDVDEEVEFINDDHEDDDSGDDSDDDSIDNRLCTFTQTQKEFMNQHWYHCHTCKMVDGVGVCSVCAKVCHLEHDITYSKFGSFFCDCGAKEDGSCKSLVKRQTSATSTSRGRASPVFVASPIPTPEKPKDDAGKANKLTNLPRDEILLEISSSSLISSLIDLETSILPIVDVLGRKNSMAGKLADIQSSLSRLHTLEKECVASDNLMVPTLGSQEGAFENVRMNYAGDQGQTIRQLISGHMVRRVVMSCLNSNGKSQYLAVAHEKGKITILQLSALLRQADASQKKLTLTRLGSAPVPFTVLSITASGTDEHLAVNGLKDCHVLTFGSNGCVSDHLVLHPQLDANNFIVKTVWMPGSQTELCLVTADFVKIYDLSKDVLSPQFYFVVPSGKVRDCTLACINGQRYVLIMSSAGHIYFQCLNEESSAAHGQFYVTNIMDVNSKDVKDSYSEQVGGGGVSIFYSQTLQILFFSYVKGKSFMAPLTEIEEELKTLFPIKCGNHSLCQWAEIPGHPGLVSAFYQPSNNPVIVMVKPEEIVVQEIKMGSKSKIADMVAIRHSSGSVNRTTLILLCEDGSLKIYTAGSGTDYWLMPMSHPMAAIVKQNKPARKKRSQKIARSSGLTRPTFPVDFFEHCSLITDVEYGGNDVLQVYNVQQVNYPNVTFLAQVVDLSIVFR